jgi:hypothetical protein
MAGLRGVARFCLGGIRYCLNRRVSDRYPGKFHFCLEKGKSKEPIAKLKNQAELYTKGLENR